MDSKKVLIVSGSGVNRGGVQVFLDKWTRCADSDKYIFTWLIPDSITDNDFANEFIKRNVKLIVCNSRGFSRLRRYIFLAKKISEVLKNSQFDIVHINTQSVLFDAFVQCLSKRYSIKIRISHSHSVVFRSGYIFKIAEAVPKHIVTKTATKFAACSRPAAVYHFGKKFSEKAIIIPNCIDTKKFAFSPLIRDEYRKKENIEGCFVIGHVGRMSKEKNQTFLIDVFKSVAEYDCRARLLLIGGGELESELKEKVFRLGLKDKVIFVGVTSEVQNYMCAMDIFVLPSLFEGMPIAGLEAQASGLPCIFSDSITKDAQVIDLCSFLSLQDSVEEWKNAIFSAKKLRDNPRDAAWSRLYDKGFDSSKMYALVDKLYSE